MILFMANIENLKQYNHFSFHRGFPDVGMNSERWGRRHMG